MTLPASPRLCHLLLVLAAFAVLATFAPAPAAAQCSSAAGSCFVPHSNSGCDVQDCCTTVCEADPSCCSGNWDALCVKIADQTCFGVCGAAVSMSCLLAHDTPACDEELCCESICVVDTFCCDVRWDFGCAFFAQSICGLANPGECGNPDGGSCFQTHATGACADAACCELICGASPGCCDVVWDDLCVGLAVELCVGGCQPDCPRGAIDEVENCEQNLNDPCYFPSASPTLKTIGCGQAACGHVHVSDSVPDIDVWRFVAVDLDGDGSSSFQLSFSSGFEGFAALLPANGCPPIASAITFVESAQCLETPGEQLCIAPGEYRIVVAPGSFPQFGTSTIECDVYDGYFVKVTCQELLCQDPCNPDAGSCYESHTTPGCDDIDCCTMICATDPFCCEFNWDGECVAVASDQCATPPANDECAAALPLAEGFTPISTLGAGPSNPPTPVTCFESGGSVSAADLWFTFTSPRQATVEVTTCGAFATFNAAIAVYGGTCGALSLLACDDDAGSCLPPDAARVFFSAACGQTYYVRIGGGQGSAGLTLTVGPGPTCVNCPADLDGSGDVGAPDIAILLGAWGGGGPADLDGSGAVGSPDLAIMLGAWGPC